MSHKFEYQDLPPAQIKADEANAAKAVEEMMTEADQGLRDEVDIEIPPEDGVSPTHHEATHIAEKITKDAADYQEAIDNLPWYVQKPTDGKLHKLLDESHTKLAGTDPADEAAHSTKDVSGESPDNGSAEAPRIGRIRKVLGRYFHKNAHEQAGATADADSHETAAPLTDRDRIPEVRVGEEDIEQTTDLAVAIGREGAAAVEALTTEKHLNYAGAEMITRAAASLYNGKGIDGLTYNRLPEAARLASHKMAEACADYFVSIGKRDEITEELAQYASYGIEDPGPADVEDADFDQYFMNKMQVHVSIVGQQEDRRLMGEMYRGLAHNAGGGRIETTVPDPARMREEQLTESVPYSEAGIKNVLKVVGEGLGPVVQGLHEVAPLDISRKDLLKHTAYYVVEARSVATHGQEQEPPETSNGSWEEW